ncbi:MAG: glutamate synthase, partial [Bacilli bacterium]|nr:glutamate synthase [Bacilli bacterium]
DSLIQMSHRAGFVDGEGDGCGILLDIPRKLWAKKLTRQGISGSSAEASGFIVGHFFLAHNERERAATWIAGLLEMVKSAGFEILHKTHDAADSTALGPLGAADEPLFIQLALLSTRTEAEIGQALFELQWQIEARLPIHVVSLSASTVIYKVRGSANILPEYYPDLMNKDCKSVATIGHNRYSTNTSTIFERVQPFGLLGHNGELNTIQKLREEAEMIGIPLVPGASDSQDLNRTLEGLIHRYGYSLFEAMELAFPPIIHEIKNFSQPLQDLYMFYRSVWGPYAQGPAGIVARFGAACVFSVDALGLRPLWSVETENSLFFSSEQGVVPLAEMIADPKPLSPGEKIGIEIRVGHVVVYPYHRLQDRVLQEASQKYQFADFRKSIQFGTPLSDESGFLVDHPQSAAAEDMRDRLYAAFGWDTTDLEMIDFEATTGAEPIRSLGHDGPLAALSKERVNIADFFKETVAVVTNPAIDREREIEHFSTRVVLGPRPSLRANAAVKSKRVELQTPMLLGGHRGGAGLPPDIYRPMAHELGTYLFEDLLSEFARDPNATASIDLAVDEGEDIPAALARLQVQAIESVVTGVRLLVLDDRFCFRTDKKWLDPALAVSAIHLALKKQATVANADNLRRRTSIVVRSGAIRNLHDLVVLVGFGADAVCPYLMWESAGIIEPQVTIKNLYTALQKGVEKVISTLGIHEIRGYDRLYSSIGLKPEVTEYLETKNFYGSAGAGYGFEEMMADGDLRAQMMQGDAAGKAAKTFLYYPRIWKLAGDVASGSKTLDQFAEKLTEMEMQTPISIRHLLDVKRMGVEMKPEHVKIGIGDHSLPFVISSMSFGSQNETAYRAYAEAAYQLNMLSVNGEGGEIRDMIGKYPKHRGMQVASGRFGVNIELTNSTYLLEIKIGQGAKPGEGGHLPGSKVSAKVAAARNATPGTDLISPSNNHDIYSIEDLAQMIDELKIANPHAKVSVKVPVVPNIGTIAVGIAKAGADIIVLSGFDGGTGAARRHALKYVGLPVEIGVKEAHRALVDAGLRDKVEIWGDGGMKTGLDVLKIMLLGANRAGFGTMAMVALGCTACHACHKDTCHVGIATQIDSMEEANEKGLKLFKPRELDTAVTALKNYFTALGVQLQQLVGQLGATDAQQLVGRSDLLEQVRGLQQLDLADLLQPVAMATAFAAGRRLSVRASSVGAQSLTERLSQQTVLEAAAGADTVVRQVELAKAPDRVLGAYLSGSVTRRRFRGELDSFHKAKVQFADGSVAGNGFAAYNSTGLHIRLQGGAQDGVGKGALGGKVIILKGKNKFGHYVNGSVGKGLAYGAQKGLFIIQGDADSRAGIRLSGADLIFGGEVTHPVDDSLGMIAARANIKGFAFEYMTGGRAVVMGDPGPWICSGMTGGVIYVRIQPEMGLTDSVLRRRIAKGAKVSLQKIDEPGKRDLDELLGAYHRELVRSGQLGAADRVQSLMAHPEQHFYMIKPGVAQTDQDIATE